VKFCTLSKDGGPYSTVWAYTLIEIKCLFSIILLRFEDGSRDAYHSHAFNCISWLLSGGLVEHRIQQRPTDGTLRGPVYSYLPSPYPIITRRSYLHKVVSVGRSWVLTFRGPWSKTWHEVVPDAAPVVLTHGRREIGGVK